MTEEQPTHQPVIERDPYTVRQTFEGEHWAHSIHSYISPSQPRS